MTIAGLDGWVPVFTAGEHTDSAGNTREWTDDDLDKIAAGYEPAKHEAPVVIGHPEQDHPAFGWVEKLKREGSVLFAKFRQVVPEFADMVRRGLFKKRSIALYPDLTLKHIGFLGAAAPAVKGLADVKFSGDKALVIEFASRDEARDAQETRAKKWGIGIKEGGNVAKPGEWEGVPDDEFLDPVNYRYPCPDAERTRAAASCWGQEKNNAKYFTEERAKIDARLDKFRGKFKVGEFTEKEEKMMTWKTMLKSLFPRAEKAIEAIPDGDLVQGGGGDSATFSEADVKAREKAAAEAAAEKARTEAAAEFAEKERARLHSERRAGISVWCEAKVKEGRLTPAIRAYVEPVLEALSGGEPIEFGEKKEKLTPFQLLQRLFDSELPKLVTFGEVAGRDRDVGGDAGTKLAAIARAKREKDPRLSFSESLRLAQIENQDLAREVAMGITQK